MSQPFEELASLDKLVHEPARLAVLTALSAAGSADFVFLQRLTGLNKGTLSSHLSKLEEAGMVQITKQFRGKTPNTAVQLTNAGQTAIDQHWQRINALHEAARHWRPDEKKP